MKKIFYHSSEIEILSNNLLEKVNTNDMDYIMLRLRYNMILYKLNQKYLINIIEAEYSRNVYILINVEYEEIILARQGIMCKYSLTKFIVQIA